jgi:hypothetical protein
MNIKAQGLLNATRWIEENYGQRALSEVVQACGPAVRERYVSAIGITWHPVEEFVELVDAADRLLGKGDGKLAEEIGASAARANLKGVLVRAALYVANPELLVRRAAGLWRQYNDEGEMRVLEFDESVARLEVAGMSTKSWTFCCAVTGWFREVATAAGIQSAVARHPQCRAKGAARCVWEVRGRSIGDAPQT